MRGHVERRDVTIRAGPEGTQVLEGMPSEEDKLLFPACFTFFGPNSQIVLWVIGQVPPDEMRRVVQHLITEQRPRPRRRRSKST